MTVQQSVINLMELVQSTAVEWKELGDVAKISSGGTPKTGVSEYYGGDIPWLRTQEINFRDIWDTEIKITSQGIKNSSAKIIPANCVIMAMYGATVGKVGINKIPLTTNQACANIYLNNEILNYRFIFHYLYHQYKYIKSLGTGSQTNINAQIVKSIKIPLPPLEIQEKIVKVLDKFTELEATLEAELQLRRQQYNYYRDFLLNFDGREDVEWKRLGEVALDFGRGKSKHRPRNDVRLYGGDIPFIQTGDIKDAGHIIDSYSQTYNELGLSQSKLWKKGTLCITIAANIAETAILGFDACFPDSVIGFVANPNKTTTYYVEYLLSNLKTKLQKKSMGSAQENINLTTFNDFLFPFPPLSEQARIVAILDKFDTLTTSLTEGLPREIALRRQQYEYYREQLLNFPRPTVKNAH